MKLVHQPGKLGVPVFIWTTLTRAGLVISNIFPGCSCQLCRLCVLVMVCEAEHTHSLHLWQGQKPDFIGRNLKAARLKMWPSERWQTSLYSSCESEELCLTPGGTYDLGIVPTLFSLNVGETPRLCFSLFPASSISCCLSRPDKTTHSFY